MSAYALNVSFEDHGVFRWVLLEIDGETFRPHSHANCDFDSYEAALNAGTLELAAVDQQPYENEAADPVGDANCAESNG